MFPGKFGSIVAVARFLSVLEADAKTIADDQKFKSKKVNGDVLYSMDDVLAFANKNTADLATLKEKFLAAEKNRGITILPESAYNRAVETKPLEAKPIEAKLEPLEVKVEEAVEEAFVAEVAEVAKAVESGEEKVTPYKRKTTKARKPKVVKK